MAVFGTDLDRPLYGRGPSAGLRFTGYAAISIALMYYDQHGHLAQRLRFALEAAAYPVQVAVSSPGAAWRWLTQSFESRDALRAENQQLSARVTGLELSVMRQAALEQENSELRALRASLPPLIKHWQLAEIISVETNPLRQRVVINKRTRDGVVISQAVVDGNGVLGQVARVGPWSAEVILVTDPEHAIQREILARVAAFCGISSGRIGIAVDGCSLPVFHLPLANLALAYARLMAGAVASESRRDRGVRRRIRGAMCESAGMVAGRGRFTTDFLEAGGGRWIGKEGAEGVYAIGIAPRGPRGRALGIAFKIEDGSTRARDAVTLDLLDKLGLLTPQLERRLVAYRDPVLHNMAGREVGFVEARVELTMRDNRVRGKR